MISGNPLYRPPILLFSWINRYVQRLHPMSPVFISLSEDITAKPIGAHLDLSDGPNFYRLEGTDYSARISYRLLRFQLSTITVPGAAFI